METNLSHSGRRGAALIVTVIVLAALTLLLTSFLTSMSLERRAAGAVADSQRAVLVAGAALSHAEDLLRTNIPEPARLSEGPRTARGVNWYTNPGRLTIVDETAGARHVNLHTGEVTEAPDPAQPRDAASVDLNQPLPGQTAPAITGTPENGERPPMRVKWVNLLRDPGAPAGRANALAARYAFWIDDESTRLNFNTASGKPGSGTSAAGEGFQDADYVRQVTRFPTPLYMLGTRASTYAQSAAPQVALGRPQSVNLDVLFTGGELKRHELQDHLFLHGYHRYPEALFDFLSFPNQKALLEWYQREKFNLTFYNRSPELNAFNRSRFFTTYVPLSLEAGPAYQHPFVFDPTGAYDGKSTHEVLHLNSLLGTFGYTSKVADEDGAMVDGGNVVNRAQVEMLNEYLHRKWPGYQGTFADKYGEAGVRQLTLNTVLMARMATTQINTADVYKFSQAYSYRTTSANYSAATGELAGKTPERNYWRFQIAGKEVPFLPQTPGPHITEIRLCVKATEATPPPKNSPANLAGYALPRYLQYWYEVEYYMHGFGPVVDMSEFPTRMDYFEIVAGKSKQRQQFGPKDPSQERFDADWADPKTLGRLVAQAPRPEEGAAKSILLGPAGSSYRGKALSNRVVVSSEVMTLGQRAAAVPYFSVKDNDYTSWDPFVFDAATEQNITVDIRLRPGMGIFGDKRRPRQMIPLGETRDETLQATFTVNLRQTGRDLAVDWQINDPRLSHLRSAWEQGKTGPANKAEIGTLGLENRVKQDGGAEWIEPTETSPEKSKFRYLQRAPEGATIDGFALDRPDEYTPQSRITSPGYWSFLHTGMQAGKPWQTLSLSAAAETSLPPDWLFLDLIGATYPMANDQWRNEGRRPDEFSTASFMNSTAGQVNINTRIYPRGPYFAPPPRTKPVQGVFRNLPYLNAERVATETEAFQTDERGFAYVGELAQVLDPLSATASSWQREFALRNMAGVLTTKTNTFGVWGVAQVVRKAPGNLQYDRFERGDTVSAEKRFYALVERYLWAGRDGVPGNAHASAAGRWDRLAVQAAPINTAGGPPDTLFQLPGSPPLVRKGQRLDLDTEGSYPEYDGPEAVGMNPFTGAALGKVRYRKTSLAEAYNPPQAVTKYRVISFKFLDQ